MDLIPEERPLRVIPISEVGYTYLQKREVQVDKLSKALVVDVETTGLHYKTEEVIEIAGVFAYYDESLAVRAISPQFTYMREPDCGVLTPKIEKITGLTMDDLRGKKVDLGEVIKHFSEADVILAHNMPFDRPFIETLIPDLLDLPLRWGCSCHDGDWKELGFTKKSLGHLVKKTGYEFNAHRALDDCIATAFVLMKNPVAAKKILLRATKDSFKVDFLSRDKSVRDVLKVLGYAGAVKSKYHSKYYFDMSEMERDVRKIKSDLCVSPSSMTKVTPLTRAMSSM